MKDEFRIALADSPLIQPSSFILHPASFILPAWRSGIARCAGSVFSFRQRHDQLD
jgi:hypothetical protein